MSRLLAFFVLIFLFTSCNEQKTNKKFNTTPAKAITKVPENKQDVFFDLQILQLPFSSENVGKYIFEEDTFFYLKADSLPQLVLKKVDFNQTKCNANETTWFYGVEDKNVFPIGRIMSESSVVVASLVSYYGENDVPGVFVH